MTQITREMSDKEVRKKLRALRGSAVETTPEERKAREKELEGKDRSYILRKFGLDDV